jgi:hypothetical protein
LLKVSILFYNSLFKLEFGCGFCQMKWNNLDVMTWTVNHSLNGYNEPREALTLTLFKVFDTCCMYCLEKVDSLTCKSRKFKTQTIRDFMKVKHFSHVVCEKCSKNNSPFCNICSVEHINMV